MEIKSARLVEGDEVLGKVALEKELLEQHKQEIQQEPPPAEPPAEEPKPEHELDDNLVLSHINKKYQKGFSSFDEILTPQIVKEELPGEVSAFYKFNQETGRGMEDFIKLQRDYTKENPDKVLAEYIASQNPEFDEEDIAHEMKIKFGYDEALDSEDVVKSAQRARKKELSKAIAYFEEQKEQYKIPTGSAGQGVPDEDKELYEAIKKEVSTRKVEMEKGKKLADYFVQKTNELFSNDFKGFEFKVGDKAIVYTPGEVEKIKQAQINVGNFINSHLNEEGYLKDPGAYHKSLAVAMNPDLFAKHFYEQGKADALAQQAIDEKNIHMGSVRSANDETIKTGGIKARMLDESTSGSLRIPSTTKR